jgi:hypothetical protein
MQETVYGVEFVSDDESIKGDSWLNANDEYNLFDDQPEAIRNAKKWAENLKNQPEYGYYRVVRFTRAEVVYDQNQTLSSSEYSLFDHQISRLKGKVLTVIDASFTDAKQRLAVKDLLRSAFSTIKQDVHSYFFGPNSGMEEGTGDKENL